MVLKFRFGSGELESFRFGIRARICWPTPDFPFHKVNQAFNPRFAASIEFRIKRGNRKSKEHRCRVKPMGKDGRYRRRKRRSSTIQFIDKHKPGRDLMPVNKNEEKQ